MQDAIVKLVNRVLTEGIPFEGEFQPGGVELDFTDNPALEKLGIDGKVRITAGPIKFSARLGGK